MSQYNYSFKKYAENIARVVGRDLPISTKQSIEICSYLRGMELEKAQETLERVIAKKQAVPFRRFTEGAGHKKGIGAGKFPVNAAGSILKILKSAESNAQNKGLGSSRIIHMCAQQAAQRWHYGRWRRRRMKRTHIEVVVEEIKGAKKPKKEAKPGSQKQAPEEQAVKKEPAVQEDAAAGKEQPNADAGQEKQEARLPKKEAKPDAGQTPDVKKAIKKEPAAKKPVKTAAKKVKK